ncbi:MAG: hypothetical protein Q9161_007620 [Pseudevernia consocians]
MGLSIVADDIRNMAGFAINKCVRDEHSGGMITKHLAHVTGYLISPETVFPGPALRMNKISHHYSKLISNPSPKAPSTIFISVTVWNHIPGSDRWNPGNYDYKVGDSILDTVKEAAEEAPPGTALQEILQERYEYIDRAVDEMDRTSEHPWWADVPPEPDNVLGLTRLRSNKSQTIRDLTESCVGSESRSMASLCAQLPAIERRENGKRMRWQRTKNRARSRTYHQG